MASETVGDVRPESPPDERSTEEISTLLDAAETAQPDPDERYWITDEGRAALWQARRDEAHASMLGRPWPKVSEVVPPEASA